MIIIERAEKDDGGIYSCVATNIVGSVQVSTELIVGKTFFISFLKRAGLFFFVFFVVILCKKV